MCYKTDIIQLGNPNFSSHKISIKHLLGLVNITNYDRR